MSLSIIFGTISYINLTTLHNVRFSIMVQVNMHIGNIHKHIHKPVIWKYISHTLYYNSDLAHLISAKTLS